MDRSSLSVSDSRKEEPAVQEALQALKARFDSWSGNHEDRKGLRRRPQSP